MQINDMPKIESPFVRKIINGDYLVTPEIAEGYEWVFNDDNVLCTEKLDGTNVSIVIENGVITSVWNRTARIPFFNRGKKHIIEGVLESYDRGYMDLLPDGQHFGELIGEKVNGNRYKIEGHLWIPFETFVRKHLAYKSWGKYPKDYQTISGWLRDDIFSLFMSMKHKERSKEKPEGLVFVQLSTGKMAKLRCDMYDWCQGHRHKEVDVEEVI